MENTESIDQVKADVLKMFDVLFPMLADHQKESKGGAEAFLLAAKYRPTATLEKMTGYVLGRMGKLVDRD